MKKRERERERERMKREGKNPIIELAHWRMTIQKGAARIEMPLASILNSLLARDRSRSQAFVVCVSMMKYERVTCPLDSHSLPFLSPLPPLHSFLFYSLQSFGPAIGNTRELGTHRDFSYTGFVTWDPLRELIARLKVMKKKSRKYMSYLSSFMRYNEFFNIMIYCIK